jgi:excisionase family DNA binding protein
MFEEKIEAANKQLEPTVPIPEKRTYTVSEIQEILEIGKTTAYALIKEAPFSIVRVGGSIRISKKSFDDWLDNQA